MTPDSIPSTPLDAHRETLQQAATFLFVPGDRPERFAKALDTAADIVVIDWEASVIPDRKHLARQATRDFLKEHNHSQRVAIRLNPVQSKDFAEDCRALQSLSICGVLLTMVESVEHIRTAQSALSDELPFVAMIETAKGVIHVNDIASCIPVCRLAFGNMDYQTDLALPDLQAGMIYPSSVIAVASRAAGLPQPVAGVTANFSNPDSFHKDAEFERTLGFSAKLCIHPGQIAWAHKVFEPSEDEVAWARSVIDATQESHAVQMNGVMVDRPVVERAINTLARSAYLKKRAQPPAR